MVLLRLACAYLAATVLVARCDAASLIDDATPSHARTLSTDGVAYALVMSDEFNEDGRSFEDGMDPKWTAIEHRDSAAESLVDYHPNMVTTDKGNMVITSAKQKHPEHFWTSQRYDSGMVVKWTPLVHLTDDLPPPLIRFSVYANQSSIATAPVGTPAVNV